MANLIQLDTYPVKAVLRILLRDKTMKRNIIFATDTYEESDPNCGAQSEITEAFLLGFDTCPIQPRIMKDAAVQQARTRKNAEVFTPSWIVNKMNNHCDTEWFGRENVFNVEQGQTWITTNQPISFEGKKTWKKYVDSKRIEITCGEAPYIVSRYDAATGETIPIENRIGILDRKLRVVNENAAGDDEWLKWTQRAFWSSYGYEYQGDNLLVARINVLLTFTEYYEARFHTRPDDKLLRIFANIICWNFWQMDGITGTIPFAVPEQPEEEQAEQLAMFDFADEPEEPPAPTAPICRVMDWTDKKKSISYDTIRGGNTR